ncbi:BTAD domain-containing putative transcriptional regulator [Actinoplanes sp. NPDC049599]|uniref:BTAD domain-containing putative transcriptional regulator n=1 Tax=Actinoplanes sp. NPDC049599 TaxID=3363903 RepID=UPI0037B58134
MVDDVPRPVRGLRRKAVLTVLALHRGEIVSTDRLIDIVWGAERSSVVVNTLQSHMSHLRRVLGRPSAIVPRPPGYLLELGPGGTDAEVAEDLVKQGTRATDPARRGQHLRAALRLWRGRPLADLAGVPWLEEQAQRLDQLWLQATRALIETRLALGEHAQLLPELERLAHDHPLDEQIQEQLILALYRGNRQADALAAFRRLRLALADQLGIDPSRTLRELEAAILRQDPALQVAAAAVITTRAGARRVRLGHAEVVGRVAELAALRDAVHDAARGEGGALVLLGESGIGKTRLSVETGQLAGQCGMSVLGGRAATATVQFRPLSEALLTALRRYGLPDDPDLLPYLPALSRLVPEWRTAAPAVGDDSLVVLAEAVLRLLITWGGAHGCVLILEDLHDADADTLAVIDYLIDNAAGQRLLVLGTARPEPGPALQLVRAAQRRRAAEVIELRRLDDDAVRRLAGACLGVAADEVPEPVADQLLRSADGLPLHVEELLAGMVDDRVLVPDGERWRLTAAVPAPLPVSLVATLTGRAERLSPDAVAVLQAAALLGRRFPASVAGAAAGVTEKLLTQCLREAVDAQLVVSSDDPAWFEFRHALTAAALQTRLLPMERAALARRAAPVVESSVLLTAGDRELLAAELWIVAGEPRRAAEWFGAAGRRAAAHGALSTGVTLLERAFSLARARPDGDGPAGAQAEALGAALLDAYARAARIGDAYGLSAELRRATPGRRAAMHLCLARVAVAAGTWKQGLDEVAAGRRLLGARPDPAEEARLDAVEAALILGNPTADRLPEAVRMAERALHGAEQTGQPDIACSALETLGRCARLHDLAGADALYETGLAIAEAHDLAAWRIALLYHLGADDGIRDAGTARLTEALAAAEQAGAVVTALDITLELSVVRICRGEVTAAAAATARCEQSAARLRLTHTRLIALGERIMVAAHRGRREEVDALMVRYRDLGGEDDDFASAVHGFGLAIGHLLHEDADAARAESDAAVALEAQRPPSYLSFVPGPHLLLSVLDGRAGAAECDSLGGSAQVQAGWNRQFVTLSQAVVHARAGDVARAGDAMDRFLRESRPYPLARHLGLRLVAAEAIEGGWGDPVAWLRAALAHFHDSAPAVARACRALLRKAGVTVPQHRQGSAALPAALRALGITVREHEVFLLVRQHLTNREIARRLFLSPRTVEKHVADLLTKTGTANRSALATFGDVSAVPESG